MSNKEKQDIDKRSMTNRIEHSTIIYISLDVRTFATDTDSDRQSSKYDTHARST